MPLERSMSSRDDAAATPTASEAVRRLVMGFRASQLVHVAARLGLADLLATGPRPAADLAEATGAHPQALSRLLRALSTFEIFAERPDGKFESTPFAEPLRRGQPLHRLALIYGEPWLWQAYGNTWHSVMTGEPAFDAVHGQPLFDYLEHHPDAAAAFDQAMTAYSAQEAAAVLAAYDFSRIDLVVDVAGGQGRLLAAILAQQPQANGLLFERPSVIDRAREVLEQEGIVGRCALQSGDFFDAVPSGGDLYLLKSVLHNWSDEPALAILRACRAAMRTGSRLLVIERVVADGSEGAEAKLFDINMLVVIGGLERSAAQYRQLFERAGFDLQHVIPTRGVVSLLEARPRPI